MTTRVYAYLRASTKEQDASRAKQQLDEFAQSNGMTIATYFTENESGASLQRPELFRLLEIAQKGDVMLVEQVDRLSRLSGEDWNKLRSLINEKGVKVVALDLPTSHQLIQSGDEFTNRMLEALNGMMLDMLAAIARKDYTDRKRRQTQGIVKAKAEGKFKGRPEDTQRNEKIAKLLQAGMSYSDIMDTVNCSRATVAKVSKSLKELA
ncbi:recombinase family protein [Klebsiella pneumoniae]|uniref:recombinase family protein n=1 Tax=Enterobacteriaceae TaxID=543 RepID=UPI000E2BAC8E|nr:MULTISPECIES: recombinase family protein [Klebsiella]HCT5186789.1 recombinase family protein [Klebsiella michiganensis]HED4007294.1 recombinase family protein [Klebsiella variicola subsp. variicola]EIV9612840.1 recombinase family protein [Klebsiella pneumoniae]EKZ9736592.1 recombinase family protein [Klebsiella pneumoniae]MBD7744214.1 recombinase family protein [Klebsiella pneumoniae]